MSCLGYVDAVLVGRVAPLQGEYARKGGTSAIAKSAVAAPVHVGREGLAGDAQADLRVHGGPDKAVHHYAFDHYAAWRAELGALPVLDAPGAFGENLSTRGIDESTICLGDRLRIGEVVLEVSQSRQPCWKLNARFGVADMAARVQKSGRPGWYYRVLETGNLKAGDAIELLDRPHPAWPLSRIIEVLYLRTLDFDLLTEMQALPLTPSWRRLVEGRLARRSVEDWSARLRGSSGDV